jgi:hypothetical protein
VIVHKLTHDPDIDFDILARVLARLFEGRPPTGRAVGLQRVARAIQLLTDCPPHAAAQVVGALLFRHQLVLFADGSGREIWRFCRPPARC